MPFGPGRAWLVVRAADAADVAAVLQVRTLLPANWAAGLAEVRQAGVFVAPPVDGFVFAVGADLSADGRDVARFVVPLVERLAARYGGAAWFRCDGAADRFGWAVATRAGLERGYAYDGEHGHVWSHGPITTAEEELGCFVDDPRDTSDDDVKWWPDERVVLDLAAAWSRDPRRLGERPVPPAVGWVGRL
ncbi:MAG: hypothetical protein JNL08_09215 [Planctomycetes bacterium]|nr:hypothetical protein [Planctomycetota bacterium]